MFNSKEIAKRALLRAEEIKAKKKRGRMWRKSTMLVAMCAASVVIVIALFPISKLPDEYIEIDGDQIPLAAFFLPDENAKPYTEVEPESNLSFIIPGYDSITIPANATDITMVLLNPEGNSCYLTFEITMKDTGETLYMSGLVAPSMCIENVTLSMPIAKGEYEARLIIRAYKLNSLAEMNGASVEFNIIAE